MAGGGKTGPAAAALKKDLSRFAKDAPRWPLAAIQLYLGEMDAETFAAPRPRELTHHRYRQKCEKAFFLGEWHLLNGRVGQAKALLSDAVENCARGSWSYRIAVAESRRLAAR